jgi:hypothetical protein
MVRFQVMSVMNRAEAAGGGGWRRQAKPAIELTAFTIQAGRARPGVAAQRFRRALP